MFPQIELFKYLFILCLHIYFVSKISRLKLFLFVCVLMLAVLLPPDSFCQDGGKIRGKVIDEETLNPVEGAEAEIPGSGFKAVTNSKGEFEMSGLEFGTYEVRISCPGYQTQIRTDLTVYASKPLTFTVKLLPGSITTEEIEVKANFFRQSSDVNISSMNLDYEEIRRAPGATEDISRMLQSAPGVTTGNDQRNDLIIRGGSPAENLLLIDGIEVPNINHFGTEGSTSGAIGFINSKFILETNLLTGGFPAVYGDKLSGVVDISFREGSRKNFFGDVNLSIAGFGGIFEGPISEKGSYLFSVRRSYLELIRNSIRLTSVPNYWDFNLKVNYELSPFDRIKLVGLLGIDEIDFSGESAENNPYGNSNSKQKTLALGVNYTKSFKKGYWESVLSEAYSGSNVLQIDSRSAEKVFQYDAGNNEIIAKTSLNYVLNKTFTLNSGVGGKLVLIDNETYFRGDTSAAGYAYDTIDATGDFDTYKLFGHVNVTGRFMDDLLTVNAGLRADYIDYIGNKFRLSPRAGMSWSLTPVSVLNLAAGIYYQSPEYLWLSNDPRNNRLNFLQAVHYIAGVQHYFAADLKATLEFYYKDYDDYPVWKDIPNYILIDGGADFGPNIVGEAVSAGKGIVRGIDFTLQKKLSDLGLYGLLNYSYASTGFSAIEGGVKPGAFDAGHQLTLIAGYQFKNGWLLGARVKFSGGRPYTPIDEEASENLNREVYSTDDFNSARYPDYFRVDLRIDKKFDFSKASLIAYIELQNVFDRENIYSYYWDEFDNALATIYQWAFFPVGGISFQF